MAKAAGLVNRHYHPHEVFAYTISGKWGYLEHDWTATAGDFIYETPGEAHTLVAYEHDEPMKVFFIVKGPLIWLDENGEPDGYFDVHSYIALCRAHYDKVGLGAALIDKLYRRAHEVFSLGGPLEKRKFDTTYWDEDPSCLLSRRSIHLRPLLAAWVEAAVPYLADLSVKPVTYNPPIGTGAARRKGNYRDFKVRIHNARPLTRTCRSTARPSSWRRTRPQVRDFYDKDEIRRT